jgi:enoyl-CoA hydratase
VIVSPFFSLQDKTSVFLLRLQSPDGTNRLTQERLEALQEIVRGISARAIPLVIAGNTSFFSAGAELSEIAALDGPSAYEFSKIWQDLVGAIDRFPAPVYAAVAGSAWAVGLTWRWLAISGSHLRTLFLDTAARPWG